MHISFLFQCAAEHFAYICAVVIKQKYMQDAQVPSNLTKVKRVLN